jgi:hypothetical protein
MIKIKRFYVVHEPNEIFLKIWSPYNVGNGAAFTESLLLQKGHFLSSPPKGHLFTSKKVGRHLPPLPPGSAAPD